MAVKEVATYHGSRQERIYGAEREVHSGREFASITSVQEYLDALTASYWWSSRFARVVRIEAERIRSRSFEAVGKPELDRGAGVVGVTRSGQRELTLLHEVAHAACDPGEAHGRTWAATYLELVYRVMGEEPWLELRSRFVDWSVDFG